MKVTTLNLRHGGSKKAELIADWLGATGSDVIVCSEAHRGPSGDRLASRLQEFGYRHALVPEVEPRTNTVAIFSREEAQPVPLRLPEGEAHRAIAARIGGITVVGVYFAQSYAKRPLFSWLLQPPAELPEPTLVIGDFNTGLHRIDEQGATFHCAAEFGRLGSAGWADAWRLIHKDAREFSWYSSAGNGFRLDHAFVSGGLEPNVVAAFYDHATREGLTDHSALTVEIQLA
jgi:exonuclease III